MLARPDEAAPVQTFSPTTSSSPSTSRSKTRTRARSSRGRSRRSGLERIAIASAFQAEGTVVMHMATQIRPDIPILFLETGYQFAETLAFKEQLAERLGLNVVDLVRRVHGRAPGRGVRSAPVRARPRDSAAS